MLGDTNSILNVCHVLSHKCDLCAHFGVEVGANPPHARHGHNCCHIALGITVNASWCWWVAAVHVCLHSSWLFANNLRHGRCDASCWSLAGPPATSVNRNGFAPCLFVLFILPFGWHLVTGWCWLLLCVVSGLMLVSTGQMDAASWV